MKKISTSTKTFLILISTMILIKIFDTIFNPNKIFSGRIAMFSWIEILIVLILGTLGLMCYKKINLPKFWNSKFKTKKAILISIGLGLSFALIFVIYDSIAIIGDINVGWPLSPIFYIWGAISSEIIYRLFAISCLSWLFGNLILRKKYNTQVYWFFAIIISSFAAFSIITAFAIPEIPLNPIPNILILTLGALVFASEITEFGLLKKYGLLSPLTFRLSFYSIWHIIWPIIFY